LTRGTEVVVVRKAPLGDPIELLLKGYNLSLRKSECENVYVLVEEEK
ncbi:MAG TPA: ferrous iron transport protein A, partial [Candidatus Bathyarchaeota archaeon]|nr:ferrous iron transport protein A [Candidatus Bathyarchaeota archaeon]